MASKTILVRDAIATKLNTLTGLPITFTAVAGHELTVIVENLGSDIIAHVSLGNGRTRTRSSRGKHKVTQNYLVQFVRAIAANEVDGETVLDSAVNDWCESIEAVEKSSFTGVLATQDAVVESFDISLLVDYQRIKESQIFQSMFVCSASWHESI